MPTAIIIDDTPRDRERLRGLLAAHPEVRLVAECASVDEGKAAIAAHRPELVFLDVVMPVKDGLALMAEVPVRDFRVIFVTSFEEFAVRAFRLSALDYLLKPVVPTELAEALAKYREEQRREYDARVEVLLGHLTGEGGKRITLSTRLTDNTVREEVIALSDIACLRTGAAFGRSGPYTFFSLSDGELRMASHHLGYYEPLVCPLGFVRVGQSSIVNPAFIAAKRGDELILRAQHEGRPITLSIHGAYRAAVEAWAANMLR